MRHRNRLLAVATALAMTTTVAGAAAASTADSGHKGTSATSTEQAKDKGKDQGKDQGDCKGKGDDKGASKLDDVAKRYGISPDRLEQALRMVKPLIGKAEGHADNPAVVGAFAKELGLSTARAKQLLAEVFAPYDGPRKPGPVGKDKNKDKDKDKRGIEREFRTVFSAKALAGELGVSVARARTAVDELAALASAGHGGIEPGGSAFKAIARELGVTPQQLNNALGHLKSSMDNRPTR